MNFSYSTIADVYAVAEGEKGSEKKELLQFAQDLEQGGTGVYEGMEYLYRNSNYGMEIVSMEDYLSESEEEDEL